MPGFDAGVMEVISQHKTFLILVEYVNVAKILLLSITD